MVDAQRRGSVTTQGRQAHELPVGCLVQCVLAEELLRCRDGGVIVPLRFQKHYQAFRSPEKRLAQAVSFRQDPLLVATGQEVPAVQVQHLLQGLPHHGCVLGLLCLLGLDQCLFHILDIQGEGAIGVCWQPLQAVFVGVEELVGIREGVPQVIQ